MSTINEINELFKNGILPDEFNFSLKENNSGSIDWEKVRYNTFGKNNKYTNQEINIINKLTENIKENSLTPLEEMELIQNIKISDNNIENE